MVLQVTTLFFFNFTFTEDGHDAEIEILSHKDGVLSAEFDMISDVEDTNKCKVVIHSRFLGE